MLAAEATPQIFKCTDSAGNVTYQNEACPKSAKAGRIDIFDNRWSASKDEREAEWRRNAADHHVVAGMPSLWVREALGEPSEIRDTPTAGAAQLWIYSLPDRSVQVGMLNDQVLWSRETPVASPSARIAPVAAPPASAQAPPAAPRVAPAPVRPAELPVTHLAPPQPVAGPSATLPIEPAPDTSQAAAIASSAQPAIVAAAPPSAGKPGSGRAVARGQDCKQALAGLGPPTRQRDVPALDAGSEPATEYFYDASSAGGGMRVVCANGLVEGVDRSVAR